MKDGIFTAVNVIQYVGVVTQAQLNETFALVQLILSIVTSIVLIAFRLWRWWKEASEDGKITAEEITDGAKILEEGAEDLNDKLERK